MKCPLRLMQLRNRLINESDTCRNVFAISSLHAVIIYFRMSLTVVDMASDKFIF